MAVCKNKSCKNRSNLNNSGFCPTCSKNKTKNKTKDTYICPECDNEAYAEDACLCCDLCVKWFHID